VQRFVAAAVVFLVARGAAAFPFHIKKEDLRLDITESLFADYRGDLGAMIVEKDDQGTPLVGKHFYDILSRLNIALSWRNWRLSLRFDSAGYFDTPAGSCGPDATTVADLRSKFCQLPFYLEKSSIDYTGRNFELTLGDFYVNFGRGLVLSIRKLDELGIDTTVLGGRMVFRKDNVTTTLVAGVSNVQNIDEATGRSTGLIGPGKLWPKDPYDVIAGARLEYRAAEKVIIGVHEAGGVMMNSQSATPPVRRDGIFMYGASIDVPRAAKWLSLYFEGAGQMVERSDQRQNGYALYGQATFYAGDVTTLLEFKHYSQYQRWASSIPTTLPEFNPVAYNQPPTAERINTELTSPIYDVTGPRLRVDWRIKPWVLVYASYAFFQDRGSVDGSTRHYHDPYGGVEFRWQRGISHLFLSGGVRYEICAAGGVTCIPGTDPSIYQTIGHIEWDFTQALPRRLSLEAQGQALFRRGDGARDENDPTIFPSWTEGNAYLALKWTPYLVFSGGYEWTTRPSTGAATHNFFNGSVQWNITTATHIRVFVGGMRGGLRCISGICRDFPPFTGARLEVVVRL
jgi:hypothetical protein